MTNKEFQAYLKQFPDSIEILVGGQSKDGNQWSRWVTPEDFVYIEEGEELILYT